MTLEEALAAATVDAATTEYCTVDDDTRLVTIPDKYKKLGVESDEKVKRIWFRFPKLIGNNGVDLSAIGVRVNFRNANGDGDIYIVEDLTADGDYVTFSWELTRKVTAYKGHVSFVVCAVKSATDGTTKNEWNTTLNKEGEVLEGLEVSEQIAQENPDIIEYILANLGGSVSAEQIATAVEEYMAKNPQKDVSYEPQELTEEQKAQARKNIGAEASGTAESKVSEHNVATDAHNDIRLLIDGLTTRLNALADSDDTTLDQMSEVVAYIKSNKSLIDAITTSKINVSDIIDNLTTNASNKPLSASQGVALKAMIDAIVVPNKISDLDEDSTHRTVTDTEKEQWNKAEENVQSDWNETDNTKDSFIKNKPSFPSKTSDLQNDSGFITNAVTDLANFYKKSEVYTQEEVNQLVSVIPKFSIEVVSALPTEKISDTTIYLFPFGDESTNIYTEYIYVNGAWEILGTQSVDLSGYALKTELPTKTSDLQNDSNFIQSPDTATVGQVLEVEAVDENGKPTAWKTVTIQFPEKLPNPQKLTFAGAVTAEYDGSGAVTVTIPEGSGGSGGTVRIEKLSTDTAVELEPNKLYIFPEMSELTITLAEPSDTGIANEYHFVFQSGATATTLSIPDTVKAPSNFSVDASKIYEISILEGCLCVQSWAVTA